MLHSKNLLTRVLVNCIIGIVLFLIFWYGGFITLGTASVSLGVPVIDPYGSLVVSAAVLGVANVFLAWAVGFIHTIGWPLWKMLGCATLGIFTLLFSPIATWLVLWLLGYLTGLFAMSYSITGIFLIGCAFGWLRLRSKK